MKKLDFFITWLLFIAVITIIFYFMNGCSFRFGSFIGPTYGFISMISGVIAYTLNQSDN